MKWGYKTCTHKEAFLIYRYGCVTKPVSQPFSYYCTTCYQREQSLLLPPAAEIALAILMKAYEYHKRAIAENIHIALS